MMVVGLGLALAYVRRARLSVDDLHGTARDAEATAERNDEEAMVVRRRVFDECQRVEITNFSRKERLTGSDTGGGGFPVERNQNSHVASNTGRASGASRVGIGAWWIPTCVMRSSGT